MVNADYELVIRPGNQWFGCDWRELINYRDLLWQLVRRDFSARFKQTMLGPLWFFVNPLVTTVVFAIICGRVMGSTPENVPGLLFFNAGLLAWNYFAALLSSTGNTLQGNVHLFSKVYFPRLVVPIAQVFSNLIALGVQFFTFAILLLYVWRTDPRFWNLHFGWCLLCLPLIVMHIGILGLGGGLILSAMTAKYRDLQNILGFIISSLMFVTPVMWPLSTLQEKFPHHCDIFMLLNPMIVVVEAFRYSLIGIGCVSCKYYAVSAVTSVLLLLIGVVFFQRASRSYVDQA